MEPSSGAHGRGAELHLERADGRPELRGGGAHVGVSDARVARTKTLGCEVKGRREAAGMNNEFLLTLLDEAFDKRSWHGPNLRGAIRGVTAEQAAWRPRPGG